jgi:hypothetical protein
MKKILFVILSIFTLNVLAEIENTLALTSNNYQDVKNSLILDYKAKTFFEMGSSVAYIDLEFLADNNDNTLFNPIELKYKLERDDYNLGIGFDTVFWGVAESYNPVDILNRKNLLTTYETKDKLGEFMFAGEYFFENSTLSAYYLPKFYQQKFLDKDSATGFDIAKHIIEDEKNSYGVRYKHIIDNIDLGLSYFSGVSRNHQLIPTANAFNVYYPNITQIGLDLQLTTENALYKLEYANKSYTNDDKYAAVVGVEYMFIADILINGLIEYLRSDESNIYQNDVMLGLRFDFEDEFGSEGLIGLIYDKDYGSKILTFSGSRRINNNSKIKVNLALYDAKSDDILLKDVRNNFALTLFYYF